MVSYLLFHRFSFFSINSSCNNSEAADEQQSDPKSHHTVIAGLRIIVRLITTGSGRNANIVFAGITLAIVVSVCVSSLAVLDDNATTCYGAFFPMVILVGLPIGFGVTELSKIAPSCKVGYFLCTECIFIELATAFALVVRFLTALCAGRLNLCNRLNVAGVSGRDVLPNCGYGSVSGNGDLVANCLFCATNAPSLELLAIGSSEAVFRESVFAGNSGYICHCACTAVSRKGYGVGGRYNLLLFPSSNEGNVAVYCGVEIISRTAECPALEIVPVLGRIGRLGSLLTCFDRLCCYSRATVGVKGYGIVSAFLMTRVICPSDD